MPTAPRMKPSFLPTPAPPLSLWLWSPWPAFSSWNRPGCLQPQGLCTHQPVVCLNTPPHISLLKYYSSSKSQLRHRFQMKTFPDTQARLSPCPHLPSPHGLLPSLCQSLFPIIRCLSMQLDRSASTPLASSCHSTGAEHRSWLIPGPQSISLAE